MKKLIILLFLTLISHAQAADNFAINNATGTFTILKSTDDGTGAQQLNIVQSPSATVGCTPYHLAGGTAASTNATNIKASPGSLCHITAINTTVTTYYLRLYNLAVAPTCSSATGATHSYPILPSGGVNIPLPLGELYTAGIGFCVTGGGSDTDNTAAATGVYIEGSYK